MKKFIYITLWVITGMMLAMIVHGLIEVPILWYANRGEEWHSIFGIDSYTQFRIIDIWMAVVQFVLGIIFGLWAGFKAWQKVYVEGIRGKEYIVKKGE